jgi:predicted component of type VI protein secretion system
MSTSKPTFCLGTAVEITTVLSRNNPNSVTISIEDSSEVVKITDVAMNAGGLNIYTFVWQSATSDMEGDYEVTIKATYGSYVALSKASFELIE